MTTVKQLLALMEALAPAALAEPWDNVGLLVGSPEAEVRRAWLALEVTGELVDRAREAGIDALITHHPVIFSGLKQVTTEDPTGRVVLKLARAGIQALAAHTNLDAAEGGVNDCLAEALGLTEVAPLPDFACGRLARLPRPMTAAELEVWVRERLAAPFVRVTAPRAGSLERVALVSGSGGDQFPLARAAGADCLITGEIRYHDALYAREMGMTVIEAGHDATEKVVLEPWLRHLQKQANRVQYAIDFSLAPVATGPYGWPPREP